MLFGSFVQCFHLAIGASALVTLIFILTLEWLVWTVVPKDSKVDQPAVPKVQSVSTRGKGGPNTSVEFGPSNYYVTGHFTLLHHWCTRSIMNVWTVLYGIVTRGVNSIMTGKPLNAIQVVQTVTGFRVVQVIPFSEGGCKIYGAGHDLGHCLTLNPDPFIQHIPAYGGL